MPLPFVHRLRDIRVKQLNEKHKQVQQTQQQIAANQPQPPLNQPVQYQQQPNYPQGGFDDLDIEELADELAGI